VIILQLYILNSLLLDAVTHKLQHLELAADSNEAAAVIATQQQQISVLDGELQESMEEYRKLKHKYNTIAGEVNKQQTMGRLQARVDVLELAEFTLRKEKKALLQSNQMLQVSEAALADQLKTAHSKFLDLKQLYEKNVADMKPQLEGTLEMSSKNRKELDMIKADVNSNMGRFKIAEAQFKEKEREAVELNKRVTELDAEVARQKHLIAQLNREVEKRTKLSLVAIASKSTAMEDLMHIEKMMGKAKIATTRLHKENDEQRQEIKDMEEYISQLQKMIEDSNKIHVELENQLAIKASELAAEVVQTEALKANQANFMAIGMSDEKQAEWEEREDQMRKMQERINKLTGQARRYQAKIEELSEQVMNLENELGV
jgi:chromosome segregation ATPase